MRVVFFDFEGTGVDPYSDRIVEYCFIEAGRAPVVTGRVNPGIPIPPDATEIHGISDADVANMPPFGVVAPAIQELVTGAVLCGYSCRRYDTVLLHNELVRAGQPGLPCDSVGRITQPEIDLFELWLRHENRKLVTAAKRFGGYDLTDAHAAEADTAVLHAVLNGMCGAFGLDASDTEALVKLSVPEGAIDRDGKFLKREDGVIVFNFGKSKGEPADQDLGLLEWMMKQHFMTPETKQVARAIYQHAMRRSA
jgi:DNA polymerase III subunit epsilon